MSAIVDTRHQKASGAFIPTFSPQDVVEYYTEWAEQYDKEIGDGNFYKSPDSITEMVCQLYKDKRESVTILDVASGTGIVGEKLYNRGFRSMDGLDPCEEMLNLCQPKNIYKNLICEFMTDNMPTMKTDSYDCIVSSGGMGNGHIPRSSLHEMVRIVKPGGYICIGMREEFLTLTDEYNENKLEGLMADLEKAGKWRKVERKRIDYLRNAVGIMFLYQVL